MFKQKDTIEVLKVKTTKRDVVETREVGYGYGHSDKSEKIMKGVEFTQVLLLKNGELYTREFNGSWDLADVKKWENE